MKSRPILFSAPMVRAILAGSKTQTRRIVNPAPAVIIVEGSRFVKYSDHPDHAARWRVCPYGAPGDQLWVKESWRGRTPYDQQRPTEIPVGEELWHEERGPLPSGTRYGKLRPSIFMPRWASRINLEVLNVRIEKLNRISEADAIAEGVTVGPTDSTAAIAYARLWEKINGTGSWDLNPSVWVIEFRRLA